MDLMNMSKKQSGLFILIVYALTMALGIGIIAFGNQQAWTPIMTMLIADIVMTIVIYLLGLVIKNASLYDPYWSVIPLYIIIVWYLLYVDRLSINHVLLLLAVLTWAVRLTYNWWKNWEGFDKQDWRYDMLKNKNHRFYPLTNLFGIHMLPTLIVFIQMINVYGQLNETGINLVFIIGFVFSMAAPVIQFVADKQMFDFRLNRKDDEQIINVGLWRFSRHPNYFGELLFWVGIYVMYLSFQMQVDLYIIFPILMIALFVFISVPMMEKKIQDRPGYDVYKENVSMIVPFFNKNKKSSS